MTERSTYPSDEELHEDLMEQLLLRIHVAMPGRIQSYDPVHQVADIVLQLKHTYPDPEGTGEYLHEDYPVLPSVPILFPRMGKWFMAMSVEAGDAVQVLFNSSAIGMWRRSTATDHLEGIQRAIQGISLVGDVGRHHLTHAVALLGMETYGNPIVHAPPFVPPADSEAGLTLGSDRADGTRISIYGDGSLKITHGPDEVFRIDAGTPATPPQALAKAAETDAIVSSLKDLIAHWTPVPNDGGASLKTLIAGWSPDSVATTKAKGV